MERPLEGKLVLVTGAGVRVGKAIAIALGRAGADVAAHYHSSAESARGVIAAVRADGNLCEAFQADLADPAAPASLAAAVEERMGPIAALVNSAAIFDGAPFVETSLPMLERTWAINARAPFLLTQAVARRMAARGGGDVVNVLDIGGPLIAWKNYAAYCMAKGALGTLTRCLALELAPAIRVNGVAPGAVLPGAQATSEHLASLRERIPQRRVGTAEDVAEAVLFFLAGPRFVTGQVLAIDGGRTLV